MGKPCNNAMKYVLSLPAVSFKKSEVVRDKHVAQIHSLQVMELVFEQTLRL